MRSDWGRTAARAVVGAALALTCSGLVAPSAGASTYNVRQCWGQSGHNNAGEGRLTKNGTNFAGTDSCASGSDPWAYARPTGGNAYNQSASWTWTAPAGAYFNETSVEYGIDIDSGYGGFMSRTTVGGIPLLWEAAATGSKQLSTTDNLESFGIASYCGAPGGCGSPGSVYSRIRDVRVNVTDTSPPSAPAVGGSIFDPGWKKGTAETIATSSSDLGAGLDRLTIEVNGGSITTLKDMCSPTSTVGWIASLSPCPTTGGYINYVSTTSGGFKDGSNTVEVCASEYGSGAAVRCTTRTVSVDNNAPSKPTDLAVAQGSEWQQQDTCLLYTSPSPRDRS